MAEKTPKKEVKKTPSKTKKKVVAAKTKKTTTVKKVASNTQKEKKVTKKVTKKPTKNVEKKTNSKKVEVKHSTENSSSVNKETSYKTLAIIMGIVVILLGLIYVSMISGSMNSVFSTEKVFVEYESNTVIIIEDPSCALCQVDEFVAGIKAELDPNTQIIRLDFSDETAQKFIDANTLSQVPIVVFSKSFENTEIWSQLSVAFDQISYNEVDFYLLSYNTPQIKKILEEPELNDHVITFGNQEAENIIYEFCSYDVALCALVNNNAQYLQEVREYNPEYTALYPLVEEDTKIVTIHVPQEENTQAYLAAYCAHEQGKYIEFRKSLYNNQFEWVPLEDRSTLFTNYALQLGINTDDFVSCIQENSEKYEEQLAFELEVAQSYSISQLPSFIINSYVVQGPLDYLSYQSIISQE